MKKRCIDPAPNLTFTKIYEVEVRSDETYHVINDNGERDWFATARFVDVVPISFAIKGNPKQLEAIYEDLIALGYQSVTSSVDIKFKDFIGTRASKNAKEHAWYKQIFVNRNLSENNWGLIFQLPQQYTEAWQFAKEQLEILNLYSVPIEIGDPVREAIVYKHKVECQKIDFPNDAILALQTRLKGLIGPLNQVQLDKPSVWVGCQDGTRITLEDIDKILKAQKDLQ